MSIQELEQELRQELAEYMRELDAPGQLKFYNDLKGFLQDRRETAA